MKANEVQIGQIIYREDKHKRLCIAMCLNKIKDSMKFLMILEYFDSSPNILYSNVFIKVKSWDDKKQDFLDFKKASHKQIKEIFNDIFKRKSKIEKKKAII